MQEKAHCKKRRGTFMKQATPRILTINGGSTSIKFAMFTAADTLRRILSGGVERGETRQAMV
jgi:hypothetical protein